MSLVDLVLALVLLSGLWAGWRRGALRSTLDLLSFGIALAVALVFWQPLSGWFESQGLNWGVWSAPIAFFGLFLLVRGVLGGVLGRALAAVPPTVQGHAVNRVLGLAPGFVHGAINAVLVMLLWQALPLGQTWERGSRDSLLARVLAGPAAWAEAALTPIVEPAAGTEQRQTAGHPPALEGAAQTLKLGFAIDAAPPRPDLEARMLALVNEERVRQGVAPLQADPEATLLSRAHSQDMLSRRYFSHVTPQGRDPFERMLDAGLRFRSAGENLALAPTVEQAHQGLMKSPGHRANILRPSFGRVGIGILDAGRRGVMVTQTFRN